MAITVFGDVILSSSVLAAGVKGKNLRLNARVPTDNGYESINIIWTQTLRQYTLGLVPLCLEQWQAIETLHEITEGGAYGLLLQDPKDSTVSDGVMTLVSAGVYQLHKRYLHAASARFKTRKITRPQAAGFVPTVASMPLAPTSYTLDVTTGRIAIPSAPAVGTLAWSGPFYVPVHFIDDVIDWDLVMSGPAEQRLVAGPSVVLQEIRE
ncbi:TIGR02217 family protein [Collimonas sp. OK607]|uniref:DUF2460 domain-containing protein n=1 Tax=Collimonas sp. OK607 TaxID=1798194 RepID=UPI0008EA051A|nr:DUF2460 domain-containing protein [Collimonas sp. OK607]SFB02659.1 TIGR02217 family protein [Collimonas sp. OK607]